MGYVIYAQGTMSNDGRTNALYWRKSGSPVYTVGAFADRFDESEADRIIQYRGKYTWVKKPVKDASIEDDKFGQLSLMARRYKRTILGKSKSRPHPYNPPKGRQPLTEMTESINCAIRSAYETIPPNLGCLKRLGFAIQALEGKKQEGKISNYEKRNLQRGKKVYATLRSDIENGTLPITEEAMREREGAASIAHTSSTLCSNNKPNSISATNNSSASQHPIGRQICALHNRGYSDEVISKMSRQEASKIIKNTAFKSHDYNVATQERKLTQYSLEFRNRIRNNPADAKKILWEAQAAYTNVVKDSDTSAKQHVKSAAEKHWKDLQKFVANSNITLQDDLIQSSGEETLGKNIATEIKSGKDSKQVAAVAYSVKHENDQRVVDMALSRADAIDRCISLGKKFIEHFDKIYNNPSASAVSHWRGEMRNWFTSVKQIKLKSNNLPLLNSNLHDWFFTAGADARDFMKKPTNDEVQLYDSFITMVLSNGLDNAFNMLDIPYKEKNSMNNQDSAELVQIEKQLDELGDQWEKAQDSNNLHEADRIMQQMDQLEKERDQIIAKGSNKTIQDDSLSMKLYNDEIASFSKKYDKLDDIRERIQADRKLLSGEKAALLSKIAYYKYQLKPLNFEDDSQSLRVIAKKGVPTSYGGMRHYLEVEDSKGKRCYMITDEYDGCSRIFTGGGTFVEDKAVFVRKYRDDLASGLISVGKSAYQGAQQLVSGLKNLKHDADMYREPLENLIKLGHVKDGVSVSKVDAMLGIGDTEVTEKLLSDANITYNSKPGKITTFKIKSTDGVSPMTYKKLKELGYDHEDWKNWSDDQKVEMSHKGAEQPSGEAKKEKVEQAGQVNEQSSVLSSKSSTASYNKLYNEHTKDAYVALKSLFYEAQDAEDQELADNALNAALPLYQAREVLSQGVQGRDENDLVVWDDLNSVLSYVSQSADILEDMRGDISRPESRLGKVYARAYSEVSDLYDYIFAEVNKVSE